MPLSGKDLCKLFEKVGYKLVPGGKGSHMKLKKERLSDRDYSQSQRTEKGIRACFDENFSRAK